MKLIKFLLFLLFTTMSVNAQVIPQDTIKTGYELEDDEYILNDTIQLPEIVIHKGKSDPEARKQFLLLQNRVYKISRYPHELHPYYCIRKISTIQIKGYRQIVAVSDRSNDETYIQQVI